MDDQAKSIYDLKIHEQTFIEETGIRVTRVPGGWIYTQIINRGTAGSSNSSASITSTFVPYFAEDIQSKYNNPDEEVHV